MDVYLAAGTVLDQHEKSNNPVAKMRFDEDAQAINFSYKWSLACKPAVYLHDQVKFTKTHVDRIENLQGYKCQT